MPTGRWPVRSSVQKSWPDRSLVNGRPLGARCSSPLAVLDRGADGDELRHVLAPLVAADVQPHADDAVGAELVGLLLHARHRQLARGVHRLREHLHLLALASSADCWKPMWKIDEPTTSPSGSKPASLTSRNSSTDRSEVNRPRLFCSRRAAAGLGHALQGGRVVGAHAGLLAGRSSAGSSGTVLAGGRDRRAEDVEGDDQVLALVVLAADLAGRRCRASICMPIMPPAPSRCGLRASRGRAPSRARRRRPG